MHQPANPSMIVLLILHGQTPTSGQVLPGRTPGLHLAEQGITQAREVAARLDALEIAAIYSSPMERAQETAAPTVAAHNKHLQIGRASCRERVKNSERAVVVRKKEDRR